MAVAGFAERLQFDPASGDRDGSVVGDQAALPGEDFGEDGRAKAKSESQQQIPRCGALRNDSLEAEAEASCEN